MGTQAHLVTQSEFARMAGVTQASISHHLRRGKMKLRPALVGTRIDTSHPVAVEYITANLHRHTKADAPMRTPRGREAAATTRKAETRTNPGILSDEEIIEFMGRLAVDIRACAHKTLAELVDIFGTDVRFNDWLKAVKEIEAIQEKRIKNANAEAELVSRTLVKVGIVDQVNAANIRLLTDGAKTIARRCVAMCDAGRDVKDIEEFVKDQVSSHIKPLKRRMKRAINAASK